MAYWETQATGKLKQSFWELLEKSDLHVTFMPDVILCCAILHNILLRQSHDEVEELLRILRMEGLDGEVVDEEGAPDGAPPDGAAQDAGENIPDNIATVLGSARRAQLGVYLSTQRRQHP